MFKMFVCFGGGVLGGRSRSVQVRSGHVGEIHTRRHMFGFICKNFGNLISWTKNHDTPQKIKSSYSEASFCHVFCLVFFLCTKILVYCLFLSLNCFSSRVLREFWKTNLIIKMCEPMIKMLLEKLGQGYAPREARGKLCPSRSSGKAMPLEKLGPSYAPREARARPTQP